jgi:predicted nucleic acid-binding protein
MPAAKAFLDTNIFVYLYSESEVDKQLAVEKAINRYDRYISTQVLSEFCNVGIRKLKPADEAIRGSISQICEACNVAHIDEDTISKALDIHERYQYSYYDSLIVASALESGCRYLLSEDMSDGQIIEGTLSIRNIFPK